MKKTIAIFVMLAVLCSSFAFFVSAEGSLFERILSYEPSEIGCINSKLLYENSGSLNISNSALYRWGMIPVKQGCNYRVEACGETVGEGHGDVLLWLEFQDEGTTIRIPVDVGEVKGSECVSFYWDLTILERMQIHEMPTGVQIDWQDDSDGEPSLKYNFEIYEECACEKGKQALYPKVDIEQFSVAGGETIIRDGKLLTSFEIAPGVQQTFIQVENSGFFTQNEAMVKFLGLPQGVTVNITPEKQKLKAHNIGTYSASFTVGPNVPSGTYDVTMVAYSTTGTFDTIPFKFIVP